MNYQQFIIVVKNEVSQLLGENTSLHVHTALKNNGKERIGLTITDKNINISPTIYLEEYYRQFQNGISVEDIVQSVLNVYHEVKFDHSWQVHTVKDFGSMGSKIVYKIINAKKNETLLKNIPYITYLDFAIVFYILFEADEFGTANIPITYDLMNLWGVTSEVVQQCAFQNTPKLLPASFKPMKLVIDELMGTNFHSEKPAEELMYVLSNSLRSFGAGCMLYDGILEEIGENIGESFYILPSSIHEIIIVPESNSPCETHLSEMVAEINQTQLDEEDVLSDRVYYYNLENGTLT